MDNITFNYHTHTTFGDGKHSIEENILSAISQGFTELGFSEHSFLPIENRDPNRVYEYYKQACIEKEKYKDKIKIYIGLEQDLFSPKPDIDWEYIIGSTHYLKDGDEFLPIDRSEECTKDVVLKHFDNDYLKYAKAYYSLESTVTFVTKPNIIGHFDLITKYNEGYKYFDEDRKEYLNLAYECLDVLLKEDIPFEINTGAISRGYRTTPYPNKNLLKYINKNHGRIVISSDSHNANHISFNFSQAKEYALECGFKSICRFVDGTWTEIGIE